MPAGSANISGNSNITGRCGRTGRRDEQPHVCLHQRDLVHRHHQRQRIDRRDATAASTVTGVSVAGTTYANTVSPTPPTQPFPKITYGGIDKTGYTIHTFSGAGACVLPQTFVESTFAGLTGNHIVYITGATPCTYSNSNNSTVNMPGNLMIISDWGIDISNKSTWAATTANTGVYFISDWRADGNTGLAHDDCGSGSSGKTVSTGNNTDFNTNAQAFFYSPCTVSMSNQSNFYGQVMGDPVQINNQFTMTYRPCPGPRLGTVTSFKEDIAYVREVANP